MFGSIELDQAESKCTPSLMSGALGQPPTQHAPLTIDHPWPVRHRNRPTGRVCQNLER